MPRYRVGCWQDEWGFYYIEARGEAEAKSIARSQLARGEKFDSTTDDGGYGIYGVYQDD
jgi:hypothetical protein